ncbi:MAG TPA: Gfo/Idh/MocA family oxidoreductase [Desulfobacteraceae bacterium]|nr:Gfo/Idh/MocA family oxidoreductase [Desulfobacteraceae bacterium]
MTTSRRDFIKKSAIAAAGMGAFPEILRSSSLPASEKLVIGVIGVNGMGFSNLKTFLEFPGTACAALCDVDSRVLEKRAGETEAITGKRPALFKDYRKMLDQKDIDAVIIATPDHWHALQLIHACQAGKEVYCEKPLGNSIGECNRMVDAARKYNRVIQVGQWQRSDPHWQNAVDYLQNGHLGRIRSVKVWSNVGWKGSVPVVPDSPVPEGVDYNMWLGPAPERPFNNNRFHFTFRWFWEYAGGLMTDWGVHLLDFALYGMNRYVPDSVMSSGGKYAFPDDAMVTPDTMSAIYDFGDFGISWEHTVGIYGANYGRGHGVAFVGEHGTLVVDRDGWEVLPEDSGFGVKEGLKPFSFKRSGPGGLHQHVANFIHCVKTREKPNCDIEAGAHIARFAHLGNISYRTGDKLFWDDARQKFIGNREANALIYPEYRRPWKLPEF